MATDIRPTLPPLSSLNLPTLPLSGMSDRRSSSPGFDGTKPVSYNYPKSWHRSRQLSVSSSCTDASDRFISPECELERCFPARPNVRYVRVRRAQDAHFIILQFPPTASAAPGQTHPPRGRTKLVLGAEMHRMLSKPPNVPAGTVVFPYRVIPLTGPNAPNAIHLRRSSTSSTTSQELS